ncbi:PREDICTED: uncharacterized protein LOC106895436 [Calidris pugnax]|uniref:uncharacterized protein LOC106895436 n=1 Tax=Calidris pugnax TaxID=198806 RepID=UPI00071D767E|nr:PREDICTED: uncharacterized protein LOC106895436 [Calidris pugnax]XP_014810345.1 PREDICTED: uncharacterized protein LOC106895436 [Calidris pugnax]XP_014810346.1 PREDICTED: uncharacterized protein LOC106895436 [Calidris pugnax]XP_014810347.1 PREDICTED: uncharacterized protein LOC106895436 [Calidris pugnax]XP_014810348.1 PREDICTED: uncharacterized protein LOC106895436 [Calidris pugnax]XP_014810349.1 PREDICTED: uncharacterized protein LOC106895436 [Calidris pugnax]
MDFRMPILKVLLFVLFMASDSLSAPNCTGVKDFRDCLGDPQNFCPVNISCQCKNEKPFCRCDYYRIDWQDYWYMGPKCNHLWNTLDFILVTVIPPVALVIILTIIFFSIYACRSEKPVKQTNAPGLQTPQHNPAFTAEMADNMEHGYPQSPRDVWSGQIPKVVLKKQDFDDVPSPRQLGNYSPMHPQSSGSRDPTTTDYIPNQRPQYDKFGSPSNNVPYAGYAERRQYQQY